MPNLDLWGIFKVVLVVTLLVATVAAFVGIVSVALSIAEDANGAMGAVSSSYSPPRLLNMVAQSYVDRAGYPKVILWSVLSGIAGLSALLWLAIVLWRIVTKVLG